MRFSSPFGAYEIDSLPSQPQVAHCHGLFVHVDHRGKGFAHALKQHQACMLSDLGYDYATCTVCSTNTAQKQVLQTAGWRMLSSFRSRKTGEAVELWGWTVQRIEERPPTPIGWSDTDFLLHLAQKNGKYAEPGE